MPRRAWARPSLDGEVGLSHLTVHRHKLKILPTSSGEICAGQRAHAPNAAAPHAHACREFHGPQIRNVRVGPERTRAACSHRAKKHAPAKSHFLTMRVARDAVAASTASLWCDTDIREESAGSG